MEAPAYATQKILLMLTTLELKAVSADSQKLHHPDNVVFNLSVTHKKLTIQYWVMKKTLHKLILCSELQTIHHFTLQQVQGCKGTGKRPAVL